MIAGLEAITAGDISIGGRVVNDVPPKDRDIAMVFQSYALYPHKTVAENIGFPLKMAKRPKAEIEEKVDQGGRDSRPRRTFSTATPSSSPAASASAWRWGGPSSATRRSSSSTNRCRTSTPSCASTMRVEIKELHQRLKTTIVYVTHDQIEAMTMADKIVVMRDGRVEQIGAPLDLYDQPGERLRRRLHRLARR